MQFTNEQMNMAKTAKTAEELFVMAKEADFPITEDEAEKYFSQLHKEGELSDDELDAVAGGKGEPDPLYEVGDFVESGASTWANWWIVISRSYYYDKWYYELECNSHIEVVPEWAIYRKGTKEDYEADLGA